MGRPATVSGLLVQESGTVPDGRAQGASEGFVHWRRLAFVRGVVAVGLAAEEKLDIEGGDDDGEGEESREPALVHDGPDARSIAMYPLLSRLAPRRFVVIQASGDACLPSGRARELFGGDSATRRLVVIDARNHRFSGGEPTFGAALVDAVNWVSSNREEQR